MTGDEKINAKVNFAIDATRPAIQAALDAAHENKFADENEADFAFDMELAWVAKRLPALCPHKLHVLNFIINVLFEHEHEHASAQQVSH
jgi:hypothetical protein